MSLVRFLLLTVFLLSLTLWGCDETTTWPQRKPWQVGLEAETLNKFAETVGGDGVVIRHGYLVKTWGDPASHGDWASAAKPLLSTLLFFAVHEGLLESVDDRVRPWVQRHWPGEDLIEKDRPMTFRHLANMASGYARAEAPGTHWAYNDIAIALYGELLTEVFDRSLNDAALEQLAALEFEDGDLFGSRGGAGVIASPRDFARIGWFWLNEGRWRNKQLLPAEYFERYADPSVPPDLPPTEAAGEDYLGAGSFGGNSDQDFSGQGVYGFNWWFNRDLGTTSRQAWPHLPEDAYAAIGLHGQVVLVIPSLGIVAAARGNWGGQKLPVAELLMQAVKRPLPGQIVVDPRNPHWLKYQGGGPFFLSGPGDPEGFLYRGARNPDGTRDGDQLELIDKLKGTRANSIYLMAIRRNGDGEPDETPFNDPADPGSGLNEAILDQWEQWFTAMDRHGIVIYFVFYDDGEAGSELWVPFGDAAEEAFFRDLVERFQHHKHLIWVVKEEYSESMSAERASALARTIRQTDDHNHVVAIHQLEGLGFDFADDANFDQFAIQYGGTADELHRGVVQAWMDAKRRYNLTMAEGGRGREVAWASAMGGAYYLAWQADIATTPIEELRDYGRLRRFMESTDFNRMAPHDELRFGGTQYVLARPGESYIAYASALEGDMGLKDMSAGTYRFLWFDCTNGETVEQVNVDVKAGDHAWPKPAGIGNDLAVYISRVTEIKE